MLKVVVRSLWPEEVGASHKYWDGREVTWIQTSDTDYHYPYLVQDRLGNKAWVSRLYIPASHTPPWNPFPAEGSFEGGSWWTKPTVS